LGLIFGKFGPLLAFAAGRALGPVVRPFFPARAAVKIASAASFASSVIPAVIPVAAALGGAAIPWTISLPAIPGTFSLSAGVRSALFPRAAVLNPFARVLLLTLRVLQPQVDVAQSSARIRRRRLVLLLLLGLRPASALPGLLPVAPVITGLPVIVGAAALCAVFPVGPAFPALALRAPVPVVGSAPTVSLRNHQYRNQLQYYDNKYCRDHYNL